MQAQGITPGMERAVGAQEMLNKALPDVTKTHETNMANIKSLRDLIPPYLSKQPAQTAQPAQNTQTAPTQSFEGKTATNPQTGEKIIFKNGKWSPIK